MRSPGINGEGVRGQPANPGSPGKMAVKTECVCGVSMLNYGNWNQKIVLNAENIIDAYQNEHVLWNPELNGSEEAKEQAWMRL